MLAIRIISFGCEACRRAEQPVMAALKTLTKENPSLKANIEHVTDYEQVAKHAPMFIPGLIINERLAKAASRWWRRWSAG